MKVKGPLNQRIRNIFLLRRNQGFQRFDKICILRNISHVLISTKRSVDLKRNNLYSDVKSKAFSDFPDINKAKAFITEIWKRYLRLCLRVDNLKSLKEAIKFAIMCSSLCINTNMKYY